MKNRTLALGIVSCMGLAGSGWAAGGGADVQESRALFEQVFALPYDATCDPFVEFEYTPVIAPGDVVTGRRANGEAVTIVVLDVTAASAKLGLPPADGEPVELEGILIGSRGATLATALAVPTGHGNTPGAMILTPLGESLLPAPRVVAQPVAAGPRPADFCRINCLEYTFDVCGDEPPCDPITHEGAGIQACMAAAGCRLDRCMWAACVEGRLCACEWYQGRCQRYFDRFGEPPPPWWTPGNPGIACGGSGGLAGAACLTVYAAEIVACVPSCFFGL